MNRRNTYGFRVAALTVAGGGNPPDPEPAPEIDGILYADYRKPLGGSWRYEIMPEVSRVDFPALLTQHTGGAITPIAAGSTHGDVNTAIAAAPAGGIVRLSTGTHTWSGTVNINRSDVRLEIPDGVVVNCNPTTNQPVLSISGTGLTGSAIAVVSGIGLHSMEIEVASAATLDAGDYIMIDCPALGRTYTSANQWNIGGTNYNRKANIARIASKAGNVLTLDRKVAMPSHWLALPQTSCVVTKWVPIENVVVSGGGILSYTAQYGTTTNYTSSGNNLGSWSGASGNAVRFQDVANSAIGGLITRDCPSGHYWAQRCADCIIDAPDCRGSHNTGEGGNGYDCLMEGVSNFWFTNARSQYTRHAAPATSLNRSVTCVYVHYVECGTNVDFHGAYDWGVAVVVDQFAWWHSTSTGFRRTDFREVRTKEYNHVFVNQVLAAGLSNYDSYYSTIGTGAQVWEAVDQAAHNPGFRVMPGGKYSALEQFAVGDGHMNTWIIATTGPWVMLVNIGVGGDIELADTYGTAILVPDPAGEVLQRRISGFRVSNAGKTSEGAKLFLPTSIYADTAALEAAWSDDAGDVLIPLGGTSFLRLGGLTVAQLTAKRHVKLVDAALLRHIQAFNYMGHLFQGSRPYLRSALPAPGEAGPDVRHVFSEAVTHNPGAGDGFVLNADGSIFRTINPATDITITGGQVDYQIPGLVPGNAYRFELPPGYFQAGGLNSPPVFDWDSVERPAYPNRAVHWWVAG